MSLRDNNSLEKKNDNTIFKPMFDTFIKHWWVFILSVLIISVYKIYGYLNAPIEYIAKHSICINSSNSSGLVGLASMAQNFGISNGDASGKFLSNSKFKGIFFSERTYINSMLKEVKINNKNYIIANFYIELFFKDNETIQRYKYNFQKDRNYYNIDTLGIKILRKIKNDVIAKFNFSESDDDSGIFFIEAKIENQDLAYHMSNIFLEETKNFFEEMNVNDLNKSNKYLQIKSDSIKKTINRKEFQLANLVDSRVGLVKTTESIPIEELKQEIGVLQQEYINYKRQLEISMVNLDGYASDLIIVDYPLLPLDQAEKSLKKLIISLVIVNMLAIAIIYYLLTYLRS